MPSFSEKVRPPPANRLASHSTQQPPVCTWSAHVPQSGPSLSPFPRSSHTLSAAPTVAGKLFLFGGFISGSASSDLYVFSTRDFSTTLLQTSGEAPTPRASHGAALTGSTLLIYGGTTDFSDQDALNHYTLNLLDLVSREWTRVVVYGPGPNGPSYHTTTVVGSKLFVFGGKIGKETFNDMWTLDLICLTSQPVWRSYKPAHGSRKPIARYGHVSVLATEDRIIIFGGADHSGYYLNDTWSFDISTRIWTELLCTGSIPSARSGHAAVLVDGVVYVFGGSSVSKDFTGRLYALDLSTQRWSRFDNVGPSPYRRCHHAMASEGTRVFVLGGDSEGARSDETSVIHVFDTKDIKYSEPERNAANPDDKTYQLARKPSTGPPTQEQPQHLKSSSSEDHGAFRLQNATPVVSGRPTFLDATYARNGPNGQPLELTGVNREATRLELERQLSVSSAGQTERDHRIAQLTDELALKSALLEQAEANAAEAAKRARVELRELADRLFMQTSLVEQRESELVDMQARLRDMQTRPDELLISRDQQIGQYEKELANVRAKLEAKESELEAVRLRLADAEKGFKLIKSKAEASTSRVQTAIGSVNTDEGQATRRLMERMRALEAEVASKRWNEKSIEEMECRNEG